MSKLQRVLIGSLAALAVIGAGVIVTGAFTARGGASAEKLPTLFDAPSFKLIDQAGKAVTQKRFKGKVWVADFIFTNCPGFCPRMTHLMAKLQDRLHRAGPPLDQVKLVSFSVDPKRDRPEALRKYAEDYGAQADQWTFLTTRSGDYQPIFKIAGVEGFHLSVTKTPPDSMSPISHSGRFVLIDRRGNVRGTYQVLNEGQMDKLVADARAISKG